MQLHAIMKAVGLGAAVFASQAFASPAEKPVLGGQQRETCNCKNAADCTCPKGKCKCKNCGSGKARLFESLKGATENGRLPDTARHEDARAGVLI